MLRSNGGQASTADTADTALLAAQACAGDEAAWQELWCQVDPQLDRLLRQPRFLGPVARCDDDRRAVVLAVMHKLRAEGFRRLKLFVKAREANPGLELMAWLHVVTKRVAIDYARGHPDYLDQRHHGGGGASAGTWIHAEGLPSDSRLPGGRPPVTARRTAAQLVEYARRELPEGQVRALELWSEGRSADEIGRILELGSAAAAERMIRAAVERLRRRFRTASSGTSA